MSRHLLLLTSPGYALGVPLPEAFRKYAPSVTADQAELAPESLENLSGRGYDAVVCWADREDELQLILRIRKSDPKLPVVLLTSRSDAKFRTLAMEQGASALLPDTMNLPALVGLIEQAVQMRIAVKETRAMASHSRELSRDLRELTRQTRALSEESIRRLGAPFRPAPLPLLVSDDPEQAFQMVRAFEKAEIFAPLPILRSGDEAITYLSGEPPYDSRARFPIPSLILLDLHGSGMPGLAVLGWIRQQPRLLHLPVIMLSASVDAQDIKRAYGVQANSYLIKPAGFEELVEMVKAINLYWSSLNIPPDR